MSQNLERAKKYCVYQERCQTEVRTKLIQWKVFGHQAESIIAELIIEGFINEERYAVAYASGKFKINHWGKNKIHIHLKQKQISDYCIRKALATLPMDEYYSTIQKLYLKRKQSKPGEQDYFVTQYLMSKGFDLVDIEKAIQQKD